MTEQNEEIPAKEEGAPQMVPEAEREQVAQEETPGPLLSVIGIGASAGGLSALRAFFNAIPGDTGMAFVVIVHLSPEHESVLAELLQGSTAMPVAQVTGHTALQPDHVYVIPPGKRLVVTEGHLDLADFEKRRGARLQIDTFFRSLAEHHGDGAAIILSGLGSDGAAGIQSVKEQGGLILVQDPAEAEYDGMPKSAIATGLVDIVAPVASLAEQLVLAKRTRTALEIPADPNELSSAADETFRQILAHLRVRTGHDFGGYKRTTLLRRVARRMQLTQQETLSAYLHRLRMDGEEVEALYRDLLIHVTEFFRDPDAWEALASQVIPVIFRDKKHTDPVRVWTVGCATGEEAYGIAMLLHEYAARTSDRPPNIQVFASDLGRLALDFARQGVYPEAIAANVSTERLDRFFVKDNSHYRVTDDLREMVLFTPHNLLQDPPFSKLDLILCRNLLIYLKREVQQRVYETFHYALHPGGYLFLGSAETVDDTDELFSIVDKQYRIYQRNQHRQDLIVLPALPLVPRSLQAPGEAESEAAAPHPPAGASETTQHVRLLEEAGPPSLLVDESYNVLHLSETAGHFMKPAGGSFSRDATRLVRPELQSDLRAALAQAMMTQRAVRTQPVQVRFNGESEPVSLLVHPSPEGRRALIMFLMEAQSSVPALSDVAEPEEGEPGNERLSALESELSYTRQQLQTSREEYETTVEELRAANEELQSTNEEYRSTLEELETSKEELQSINEELSTVNNELKSRMEETAHTNSDLQNLFAATEIATLFLDRKLQIKRYTPAAAVLFNLMPPDQGRPIGHLRSNLAYPELEADARKVLANLVPIVRDIRGEDERWYQVNVRPYRTLDDKIDGVVITFVDVTGNKENELALAEAKEYAESIVETIPDALLVLETDLRVRTANDSFYAMFDVTPEETEGALVYELGNGQWDIPELRTLLEDILPENNVFTGYEVSHEFNDIGTRTMLLNGRRLDHVQLILLAITDITTRAAAEAAVRRSEERLQRVLDIDAVGVLFFDAHTGTLIDANNAFLKMTGYSRADVEQHRLSWQTMTPEEWMEVSRQQLEELARTDRIGPYEKEYLHKDGSRSWMLFVGALLDEDTIVEYCIDVRERKEAEESLRRSEERLQVLTETLEERVQTRTAQVRNLVSQLTMSEQAERRRISSLLHDDLQQMLYSVVYKLQNLRGAVEGHEVDDAVAQIYGLSSTLDSAIEITRNLSVNLSPPVLHNEGLAEALGWLASQMQREHGMTVSVKVAEPPPRLNEDLRVMLFQIVRELLLNVLKHSGIKRATIDLARRGEGLQITVHDDGKGFDTTILDQQDAEAHGLINVRQRMELLGGEMEVESEPGRGTTVMLICPA